MMSPSRFASPQRKAARTSAMGVVDNANAALDALLVAEVGGDELLSLIHAHLCGLIPVARTLMSPPSRFM